MDGDLPGALLLMLQDIPDKVPAQPCTVDTSLWAPVLGQAGTLSGKC